MKTFITEKEILMAEMKAGSYKTNKNRQEIQFFFLNICKF